MSTPRQEVHRHDASAPLAAGRMAPPSPPAIHWLYRTILLAAITLAAYLPALRAGFIWDDNDMLTEQHLIRASDGLLRFWFSTEPVDYFPLTMTSLWLEWRMFHLNAMGYHLTNILLHIGSSLLVWRILERLKIPGAWVAGMLFALHPVNVESVAWITERKNTLSFFFLALALLLYLRSESPPSPGGKGLAENRRGYWLAAGAFALSLLSKTAGVMLPFVLLLCAWWQRGQVTRRDLLRTLPFFGLSLLMGLVTIWFQYHRAITTTVVNDSTFAQRLAGAGWAVWFYLGKALLPLNLMFVYPRWQIDAAQATAYLPGVAVLALLATFWCFRRTWGRPLFFGWGFFVVMLFPVLGFFNIYFQRYSFVADHWQYFSLPGIIALMTALGAQGLDALRERRASSPELHDKKNRAQLQARLQGVNRLGQIIATAAVAACAILTWRQSHIYTSQETLWRDTLARNPTCWMAEGNWGLYLANQGRREEAIRHYEAALKLNPRDAGTIYNLGVAFLESNKIDQAIAQFQQALAVDPDHVRALSSLAFIRAINISAAVRNGEEAVKLAERAVALDRGKSEWHLDTLAAAYAEAGRFDLACRTQEKAMAVARDKKQDDIVLEMTRRLQLYQSGKPFRESQ